MHTNSTRLFTSCLSDLFREIILLFIILTVISCRENDRAIREKAILYNTHSFLNNLVEFYTECNYVMPTSIKDLIGFVQDWNESSSGDYLSGTLIRGEEIVRSLRSDFSMASYADSVFLYSKKLRIGCCVYGSPNYWLNNPQKYPSERKDYKYMFRTSFFSSEGRYLFDERATSLDSLLKEHFQGSTRYVVDSIGNPVYVIVRYTLDNCKCYIISNIPQFCKTTIINSSTGQVEGHVDTSDILLYCKEVSNLINNIIVHAAPIAAIITTLPMGFVN